MGPFTLEDAGTDLEHLQALPLDEVVGRAFPTYCLSERAEATDVRFGRAITADLGARGPVALFAPDGRFLALYEQRGEHAKAVAVFV